MEDSKSAAATAKSTEGETVAFGGGDAARPTFDFGGGCDNPSSPDSSDPGTTFDAGGTSFSVGSSSRACAGELRRRRIVRARRPAAAAVGAGRGGVAVGGNTGAAAAAVSPGSTPGGTSFAPGTTSHASGTGIGVTRATGVPQVSPEAMSSALARLEAQYQDPDRRESIGTAAPGGEGDNNDSGSSDDSDGAARANNRFSVLQNSDSEEDEDSSVDDNETENENDGEDASDDDDGGFEEEASEGEDEDTWEGGGGGLGRHCAICFGGSSPSDLVVLPCCGSNGREVASSTRFCSGCIVRLARKNGTMGRVGGDGSDDDSDGDDDGDDDGEGDDYVDAVVSCSNEHTLHDVIGAGRSMHVTECPRCRDLLAVRTEMGHPFQGSDPPSWMRLEERRGCASHVQKAKSGRAGGKKRTVVLGRPPFELAARYARRKDSLRPALRLVARVYPHAIPLELFMTLKAEGPTRVHRARDDADTLAKWGILTKRPRDTYRIDPERQRLLREEDDRERAVRSFANFMMNRFLHHGDDDDEDDEDGPDDGINETLTRVAHQCFEAGGLALGRGRLVAALRLFNQTETLALRVTGLLRLEDEDDDDDDADGDGGRHGGRSWRAMAMGLTGGGRGHGRPTASSTLFRYHWQGWMVASLNVFLLAWIVQGLCVAALYAAAGYAVVRLVGWAVRGGEGGGGRDDAGGVRRGSEVVRGRGWRRLLPNRVPVWVRGPLVMVVLALLRGRMRQLLVILPHVLHGLRPWR